MQSVNTPTQDLDFKSYRNSKHSAESHHFTSNEPDYVQQSQSQKLTTANSAEKQPSKIGILILVIATIALYGFSISEFSKTVTYIVEAAVQEAIQDYRF